MGKVIHRTVLVSERAARAKMFDLRVMILHAILQHGAVEVIIQGAGAKAKRDVPEGATRVRED